MRTRVKICCIESLEEAKLATDCGADALGLVGAMPSGPGIITDNTARKIAAATPPPIASFLLTSETDADAIAKHVREVSANTVQIVNHINPCESEKLAALCPEIWRVQVIHVEDASALNLIDCYQSHIHAFLLDSGRPSASTPELGGTGRTHDWTISQEFVARSNLPVFLAGGLTPNNVADAIKQVRPFGVDVCSGVRSENALDKTKLTALLRAVQRAD